MSDAAIRGHVSIPSLDAGSRLHSSFWRKWTASVGGLDELRRGNLGLYAFDDFLGFDGTVTTNVGTYNSGMGRYQSFEDTGASIALLATESFGAIRLVTAGTDNHAAVLQYGSDTGVLFDISDAAGEKGVTLFEARVRTNNIADTIGNLVVGMAQEAVADADDEVITDTGAIADIDFIGFHQLEADGDGVDTFYRKNGQTGVQVQDAGGVLVANTWTKLGFAYVPEHPDGARIIFYQDGTALTSTVAAATFAATFPDAEELAPVFATKQASTTARRLDIDWWSAAQILI